MTETTGGPAEVPEIHWRQAYQIAEEFLRRWGSGLSDVSREDCVAEATVQAACAWGGLRDKDRYPSCVRTIARRQRARVLRARVRREVTFPEIDDVAVLDEPLLTLPVAGSRISREELIAALPRVLGRLRPLNARLLMSYYEGFSCAELAERHHLTMDGVRMRLHRSRRRVRVMLERLAAGDSGVRVHPTRQDD